MAAWLRARWEIALAAPGGARKVARGVAARAFAAMLPAFGLHLLVAAVLAAMLRSSLPAAAATCLLLGNPLTHVVLLPAEFAVGRLLLPAGRVVRPHGAPDWLAAVLPVAEETLLGGLLVGAVAAALAWALARRALRPGA